MNNPWSAVAYGNPSDGISGRTWDIILNDVLRALAQLLPHVENYLAPENDSVENYLINGVAIDTNSVDMSGELNPIPYELVPPITSFGFTTRNDLRTVVFVNLDWLLSMVYMPSHHEPREPEIVLADKLWDEFMVAFEEMYT